MSGDTGASGVTGGFFIFFSLFLQFVLRQRIVDIYVCILSSEFFGITDSGTTTWRIGVLVTRFLTFLEGFKSKI